MKLAFIASCLLFIAINLPAQFTQADFSKLHGMKGLWKMASKNGFLYENWIIENDSLLKGESYKVMNNDTTRLEKVRLHLHNGMITYSPVTYYQNQGKAVDFNLTGITGNQYTFENKLHDFPQLITYNLVSDTVMRASVSGNTKNGFKEIPYSYSKEITTNK